MRGNRQSGYNTEFDGSFVSDDEFFNTLWIKARDTAYVNIRDTFMDCPDRERAPWLGDAVNEMQIAELEIYNVYPETKSDEQETPAPAPGDPSDPSVETPAPAPNAGKPAGLSAGAIAGIAIGAAVLLTAGAAAAVVIGKKKAKRQ